MARGQVLDVFGIAIAVVFLVIIGFFAAYFSTQFHSGFVNALGTAGIPVSAQTNTLLNQGDAASNMFVSLIPDVIVLFAVGALITAWFVPTSPIFIAISVILLIFFEVFAAIFSNLLYSFVSEPVFAAIGNANPWTVSIITHFPLIFGGIIVLVIIVQSIRASAGGPVGPQEGGPSFQ